MGDEFEIIHQPGARQYWHVFATGQTGEVDGVVYDTWEEALAVGQAYWAEAIKEPSNAHVMIEEVWLTAEELAELVEYEDPICQPIHILMGGARGA
jgi:hypothetical protein